MATVYEFHEKNGWWLNELGSLGLKVHKINELNDVTEIRNLANVLKHHYYTDYKSIQYCAD